MSKSAVVNIDADFLRQILSLPKTTKILDIYFSPHNFANVEIVITDESFADVVGQPHITPLFHKDEYGNTTLVDWGFPKENK